MPRADERHGQVPVAVVVPSGPLDDDALLAWAAARVAPHKRIRAIRRVDGDPADAGREDQAADARRLSTRRLP